MGRVPALHRELTAELVSSATWPSIGVVIATRDRPFQVRRALASVLAQDYSGPMRVVVVYDGADPDWDLCRNGKRPVLVFENWRQPGLAGARNAGILAAGDCAWVALCDDDDTWAPDKLTKQMAAASAEPGCAFVTCGAEVEYDGRRTARVFGRDSITFAEIGHGRGRELAASGFLARHDALARMPERGGIGLLAEDCPPEAAAWDLLLRAARRNPIVHVDKPLVRVLWRAPRAEPATSLRGLRWLDARHPELREDRLHAARLRAEIACWEAMAGNYRRSWAWIRSTLRARRAEPMTLLAVAAAVGVARGRLLHAALSQPHLLRPVLLRKLVRELLPRGRWHP